MFDKIGVALYNDFRASIESFLQDLALTALLAWARVALWRRKGQM